MYVCNIFMYGLCMFSVYHEKVNRDNEKFIENVLTRFIRENPCRLQFIFDEKELCMNEMYNNNT